MAELRANGINFHVQRLGVGGVPVVFLHGLVMDNLSSWYFTAANRVACNQEVILFDMRGHGRTDRPATGYALADFRGDLARLLDALEVAVPVHLVGNSFGGLLALDFSIHHPERVASVFLVDAHTGHRTWAAEMVQSLRKTGAERDALIATHFQSWLGRHSVRKRNKLASAASALVYETSLLQDLEASPPLESQTLQRLTLPVGGIYGTRSDLRTMAEELQSRAPNCRLDWVEGGTHSVLWEATETVVDRIVE